MEVGLMERRMHQNNGHVDNTITNFGRAPFTDLSPNKDMHRNDDNSAQQQVSSKNQRFCFHVVVEPIVFILLTSFFFYMFLCLEGGFSL